MAGDGSASPLEAAFDAARTDPSGKGKFDMTANEQQSFLKAMKDPEFRTLLNEYMLEISDPKNRAEQEMYLRQLENENQVPTDKQLVLPTPGFVLKAKYRQKKMFVNICASDKMQPPSSTRVAASASTAAGTSWNLPFCVGPQRVEPDKGGQTVPTYDVCYHPQTLGRGKESPAFLKMIVQTALDGVDKALLQLDPTADKVDKDNFHILKGVVYKSGNPITMCISKPKADTTQQAQASPPPPAKKASSAPPPSSSSSSTTPTKKPLVEELKTPIPYVMIASSKNVPSMLTDCSRAPKAPPLQNIAYHVVQRGQFDLGDHLDTREAKSFRPRELVVTMAFPTLMSAAAIDLDVSSVAIQVCAPGYARLEFKLPFPVVEAKGKAKFDKSAQKLVVTLPVEPAPLVMTSSCAPSHVDDLAEEDTAPTEATTHDDETTQKEPTTSLEPDKTSRVDHSRWIEPASTETPDDAFVVFREYALMAEHDKRPIIAYVDAPFTVQDTRTHVSYLVHVPGIDADSVTVTTEETTTRVTFQAANQTWYTCTWASSLVGVPTWEVDVATQNMAVIGRKRGLPYVHPSISRRLIERKTRRTEPTFRVHRDSATAATMLTILVEAGRGRVHAPSVHASFATHSFELTFDTTMANEQTTAASTSFKLARSFDEPLVPDTCKVECADENILLVLSLANPTGAYDLISRDDGASEALTEEDPRASPSAAASLLPSPISLDKTTLTPPPLLQVPRFTNDLMYELD
ncbi:Aste57867_24067 [Aphanomyces stellatus]|uniref:Protein kintoun n=1 Tax=Aphanomyces stellatus TaxID=120398 RepID=A0A485LPB4_9STRA|nr:hypothetical protein As57867_023994 [Aphanomyces stellatus]VFU00710.1 Aste57867_24067 [Aphanomyces stellatus]